MSALSSKFSPEDSAHYVPLDTLDMPLLGDDERSDASRMAVWGSPHLSRNDASSRRNEEGKSSAHEMSCKSEEDRSESQLKESQLNAQNLLLMKQHVAEGNVPLRSDILNSDIVIQFGRISPTRRTFSVATIPPDSESVGPDHIAQSCNFMPVIRVCNSHAKEKDSVQDTSMASVESIQPSSSLAPMNLLNRHNLERFSAQLRAVGHTLTSEVLQIDSLMKDPDILPEGSAVSMKVEGDTVDARGSAFTIMKSQSDLAIDTQQKMASCVDDASELTNPASPTESYITLNKENLDDLRKQIASGCVPVREDILTDIHVAMAACESADRIEVSQSMIVEANPAASRVGCFGDFGCDSYADEMTNVDVNLTYEGGEGEVYCQKGTMDDGDNNENVNIHINRGPLMEEQEEGQETGVTQEEISMRLSTQKATEVDWKGLQSAFCGSSEKGKPVDQLLFRLFQKAMEEVAEVRTSMQRALESHNENLALGLGELREDLMGHMRSLSEASNEKISGIAHQFSERYTQVESVLEQLSSPRECAQHQVDKASVLEALPPTESIPAGKKIRLIVNIFFDEALAEVLLPISEKATVGMCKRELLRRIRQQGLVNDKVRYSTAVLQQDGVTLYEEDLLEDVLFTETSQAAEKGNSVRLALCATALSPSLNVTTSATVPPFASTLSDPKKMQDSTAADATASSILCSTPRSARMKTVPDRRDNFGVVCADHVESFSQDEDIERRYISEMKRIEWSSIVKEEKNHRILITKDALNRIRLILLDRATYSTVEAQRRMTRSALDKLDAALAAGSTEEEMEKAGRVAAETIRNITATSGEDERVHAMYDEVCAEQKRKERTIEGIKAMCDDVTTRLRIPSNQLSRAEELTQNAQRALILAPSMSQKELDSILQELEDFHVAMREGN